MSESGNPVLGQYELLKLLGKGGSGEVYHARQAGLDRAVALKVYSRDLGLTPESFEAFKNQVMNYLGMAHGNLVRAIDCGVEQGRGVLALEPVEGMNFRRCIEQAGPFVPDFAIPVLQGVAEGLAALHEGGVVHGAVTAGNVMFSKSGDVLLMDFPPGIHDAASMIGRLKRVPSSVVTIAPEIAQGQAPTPATDIFAFGVFAYQLLTQKQPFTATNAKEWLKAVQESDPVLPSEHGVDLPEQLTTFIFGCLDRDPANRHDARTVLEVLDFLTLELGLDTEELSLERLKKSSLRVSKRTARRSKPLQSNLKPATPAAPPPGAGGVLERLKVWHLLAAIFALGLLVVGLGFALRSPPPVDVIATETPAPTTHVSEKPPAPAPPAFGFLERRLLATDEGVFLRLVTQEPTALSITVTADGQPVANLAADRPQRWHRHDVPAEAGKNLKIQYAIPGQERSFYPPYDWVRVPDSGTFNSEGGFAIDPFVTRSEALNTLARDAQSLRDEAEELSGQRGVDPEVLEKKKEEAESKVQAYEDAQVAMQDFFSRGSLWEGAVFVSPLVETVLVDLLGLRTREQPHGAMLAAIADSSSQKTRAHLLGLPVLRETTTVDEPVFVDAAPLVGALARLGDDNARSRIKAHVDAMRALRASHANQADVLAWAPAFGALRHWSVVRPLEAQKMAGAWAGTIEAAVVQAAAGPEGLPGIANALDRATPSERAELLFSAFLGDPMAFDERVFESWAAKGDHRTEEVLLAGRCLAFRSGPSSAALLDRIQKAAAEKGKSYAGDLLVDRGQQARPDAARFLIEQARGAEAERALRGANLAMFQGRFAPRVSGTELPEMPSSEAVAALPPTDGTQADLQLARALAGAPGAGAVKADAGDPDRTFVSALGALIRAGADGRATPMTGAQDTGTITEEDWRDLARSLATPPTGTRGAFLVDLAVGAVNTGLAVEAGDSLTVRTLGVRGLMKRGDGLWTDMAVGLHIGGLPVAVHRRGSRTERGMRTDSVTAQVSGPLQVRVWSSDRDPLALDVADARPRSLSRRGLVVVLVDLQRRGDGR